MKEVTCPECEGTGLDIFNDDEGCRKCGGHGVVLIHDENKSKITRDETCIQLTEQSST